MLKYEYSFRMCPVLQLRIQTHFKINSNIEKDRKKSSPPYWSINKFVLAMWNRTHAWLLYLCFIAIKHRLINVMWFTCCFFYLVQKERRGIELKKTSVSVYMQTTNRTTHSSLTSPPAESPYRFHIRSNKVSFVWMQWIINWYWNISILFFGCHGYFGLVIIFFFKITYRR